MTSSLVGSEMCIRDRLGHPCGSPCRGQIGTGSRPGAQRRNSRPQPPHTCLLYTSDAADDM
eukprot:2388668-Prorocentrum_lima.AAC.1